MSAVCTRRGCGARFDPGREDAASVCSFHPGGPVFHEGLKSWSCCKDVQKPVLSFDDFLKIPGCASGSHSIEPSDSALPAALPSPNAQAAADGARPRAAPAVNGATETYGSAAALGSAPPAAASATTPPRPPAPRVPPQPQAEEQDDEGAVVPVGAKCKRLACGQDWRGGPGAVRGKASDDECTYHSGAPIFHEGSKGYSCCKKRVLDFDEFLKLGGCKSGRHLFVGAPRDESAAELVQCRTDFYQTQTQVIVSIYGKNASKEKSAVTFSSQSLAVDLALPNNKRCIKEVSLYGPINPSGCSHRIIAPKCEITLAKADGRSWPALEEGDTSGGQITFGVTGRTGTVGGKEAFFSETNQAAP